MSSWGAPNPGVGMELPVGPDRAPDVRAGDHRVPPGSSRLVIATCIVYSGATAAVMLWSFRTAAPAVTTAIALWLLGLAATGTLGILLVRRGELDRSSGSVRLAAAVEGERRDRSTWTMSVDSIPPPSDPLRTAGPDDELRAFEARQQLRQLDRALEVGVVITDEAGRPSVVGDRARQMLGLSTTGDVHDEVADMLTSLRGTVARVADSQQSEVTSLEIPHSGAGHGLEITVLPLEGESEGRVMLQLRDRERVRALEQNLLDAARLRGITRLYLGVAHDLRAPINAITLNLANIKDSLMELTEVPRLAEHRQTIEMLEDELRRLQRAVESLLAQTAPMSPDPETFDVRRVIEDLKFLLAAQARQQRLRLEVSLPRESAAVTARRDSIKQAVLNLVVNAFDATPKTGRVAIEVQRDDGWVKVTVSDTGSGVPDDIVSRLFEMHATSKRDGTGIGLHVARTAVEAAGGSLRLVDTGPEGTTFEILLPEAREVFLGHQA